MTIIHFLSVLAFAALTSGQNTTCSYNFDAGNDVIFVLDSSGSITDLSIENAKITMRTLIRKRMRIGPEVGFTRIALITFYKDNHVEYETSNFIANPSFAVYESEYFAPSGLFETNIRKTSPPTIDANKNNKGFAEAVLAARAIFATNNADKRPKKLFLITDFHFDSVNGDDSEISDVIDVTNSLRQTVTSLNVTLDVYGVGIGTFFNKTNMDVILKAGNGVSDPCAGRDHNGWLTYLRDEPTLPVKDNLGTRRDFKSETVCCVLCGHQELLGEFSQCSLEEFQSTFSLDDVETGVVDLQCTSTGQPGECDNERTTKASTSNPLQPTVTVHPPEGPEQPVTSKPSSGSEEEEEEEGDDAVFSAVMVLFGVVNLILIIFFILVCIYAHRLKAPPKSSQHMDRMSSKRTQPSNNIYNPSTIDRPTSPPPDPPRGPRPTRVAPPTPNRPHQDNDSGIVNEAYPEENRDQAYGNQWVADDVRMNSQIESERNSAGVAPFRMGSDRSALQRADSWATQWSEPQSDGYVKATRIDDTIEEEENNQDNFDYQDIPDSDVIEEDRGDYVNMTYIDAIKIDAAEKFNRIRQWGRHIGNRHSRNLDAESQSDSRSVDAPGSLAVETLHTSVPIDGATSQEPIRRYKPPSLFRKLLQRMSKNYENEFVIQDLHDRHQQHGPASQPPKHAPSSSKQNTGMDSELQRKLAARNKIIEEHEEEAEETQGTDYENEDAIYKLRAQRKATLDYP